MLALMDVVHTWVVESSRDLTSSWSGLEVSGQDRDGRVIGVYRPFSGSEFGWRTWRVED